LISSENFSLQDEASKFLLEVSKGSPEYRVCLSNDRFLQLLLSSVQTCKSSIVAKILKCLKNICSIPSCGEILDSLCGVEILVNLLHLEHGKFDLDIKLSTLNCLFSLLRLDKSRMEKAIQVNITEKVIELSKSNTSCDKFAIPIFCDLVSNCKPEKYYGSEVFSTLCFILTSSCWRNAAFEALFNWLTRDSVTVEQLMLSNKDVFNPIFDNPSLRIETEAQSISQIARILSLINDVNVIILMLHQGFLAYLERACAIADAKMALDILKIYKKVIKSIKKNQYAIYMNSILENLAILKRNQKSAVVQSLLVLVDQESRLTLENINGFN
jgi:hypothetical protein